MMTNTPKYVLGILNSEIMKWYFPKIATDLGSGGTRYFKQFVELIPVPVVSIDLQIETLLEEKEYIAIDKLVYELYGLDKEEIEFIEEKNH